MTEDYKCTTVQVLPPQPPVTDMLTVMGSIVVMTVLLNMVLLIVDLVEGIRALVERNLAEGEGYAGAEKTSSQKGSQKS